MTANHSFFSKLAFNIAETNLGRTKTNPSVGCVIVKDGSVISSGATSLNGRPHAEFNALSKKLNFKGSTLYVTLEPCSHYGLTPPCTNIIKNKKIKDAYYCYDDPDLRSHRKAKEKLSKNNIKIKKIELKKNDFYESYFINKKFQRPFIDAKLAISNDYYTINNNAKWITNFRSRKVGHLLRSKYDSIVSTSKTINNDNSLLNCRIVGLENNKPDLLIIDRHLKLKKNLRIFKISKNRKTYIFTTSQDKKKILFLRSKKIKVIKLKKLDNKHDFKTLMEKIYKIGKRRLLIESGLKFLTKCVEFDLVSNLYLFKSNRNLKKKGSNNSSILLKKLKKISKINVNLKEDSLFQVRI